MTLSVKRGETKEGELQKAARRIYDSMSGSEFEEMAFAPRKNTTATRGRALRLIKTEYPGQDIGRSKKHMPHDHDHIDPDTGDRRVAVAIWANGLLTVAQIVGGIVSGSLALIADAIHNFSDMASLVIAFGARKIARRPADAKMTFGYGRAEIVAALINYTSLILIGIYLVYEGAMRWIDPPEVAGWTVVILGGVALVVDALTAALTWSMQKGSVNIRALFLHNLSDALASVAVIIGGALILLYDLRWVDPAITIGIAVYVLWLAFSEISGPIRTLMLGSPPDIDTDAVIAAIEEATGVAEVHHMHFWQMGEHTTALDAHIVVAKDHWSEIEEIKTAVKARLEDEFSVAHSTLEFEREDRKHEDAGRYGPDLGCVRPAGT